MQEQAGSGMRQMIKTVFAWFDAEAAAKATASNETTELKIDWLVVFLFFWCMYLA
jgi:hypothetical protein